MAYRQQSLILAGHFSLHFSARFSLIVLFKLLLLTSATTALVFNTSSSVSEADLFVACLGMGPNMLSLDGLGATLVDATLLDLAN
jgi:hypothetical protein